MNIVLRATLNDGESLVFKQSLPVVAKYPDIPAPIERAGAEHTFYQTVRGAVVADYMPALIGFCPETHILCFEDLGEAEDLSFLYQRQADQSVPNQSLMDWLSQLHLMPVDASNIRANMAMRVLNHQHIFDLPFQQANGLSFSLALEHYRQQLLCEELSRAAVALGEIYLGNGSGNYSHCLLHGDFYPGSWLQNSDGEVFVIDPEFTFFGPGEFDLGVYMAHLLMVDTTTTEIDNMLSAYRAPLNFNHELARQFAGVEVIRRILGVAQLPWRASDSTKIAWLQQANDWIYAT